MEIEVINNILNDEYYNLKYKVEEGIIVSILGRNSIEETQLFDKIYKKIEKDKLFYLKQDYINSLFNINILEDIKYNNHPVDEKKINDLLKFFNINDKVKSNYLELSEGEIKKALLVKLFAGNYKVILLDDPTSGLDDESISKLIIQLKREKRKGRIILISSKNSEFINQVSDEIVLLNNCKNDKAEFINIHNPDIILRNTEILRELDMSMPEIIKFKILAESKKIKLGKSNNINDLIKSIYRKTNEIRTKN